MNQIEKLIDSKKRTSRGDCNEWIFWPNVGPFKWYGRFSSLRVEKENSTFSCQLSYASYFKLDIFIWMKWMNDPKSFVVKVLLGCS